MPIPFATSEDASRACTILSQHIPAPQEMTVDAFREAFAAIAGGLQETCDFLVANSCRW